MPPQAKEERARSSQHDRKVPKSSPPPQGSNKQEKRRSSAASDQDAMLAKKMQQELDEEDLALAKRMARRRSKSQDGSRRTRADPPESSQRSRHANSTRNSMRSTSNNNNRQQQRQRSSSEGAKRTKPSSNRLSSNSKKRASDKSSKRGEPRTLGAAAAAAAAAEEVELAEGLTDEEIARKLTEKEAMRNLVRLKPEKTAPPNRWTMRRICTLAIPLLVIVAAVVGIVFAFSGGAAATLTGLPPMEQQGDPFLGKTVSQLSRWDNGGKGGLNLEVVNALDSTWTSEFQLAVNDWDYGSPDALTLSTSKIAAEKTCSQILGKLKVCNGDYGDTQWLGINEVIRGGEQGYIVSSAARMNDFYLKTAVDSQRQYTMCHEIGHGFGLPHTDENFYNKDLGNCLDYTIHPWVNEHPSSMNYDVLVQLYGTVGRRLGLSHHAPRQQQQLLRSNKSASSSLSSNDRHPACVFEKFEQARNRLEARGFQYAQEEGWTQVHKSLFGEEHKLELGNGYVAHIDILLVTKEFYNINNINNKSKNKDNNNNNNGQSG